jgi:hypothetical protein
VSAFGRIPAATGPRPHGVWAGLLLGAVVISLAAGSFWGGFVLGARSLGVGSIRALHALQRERDALTAELADLRQQGIACERTRQIEQERDRSAQEQLIRTGGRSVVAVQELRLTAGEAPREFRYSFTVSQLIEDVGETSGSIGIKLSGRQGGKEKTLTLDRLKGSQPTKLTMRFDHFQSFEGHLVLPEGFEPQALTVEIDPHGDKLIASAETFPWRLEE